jgi:hypothetical protein
MTNKIKVSITLSSDLDATLRRLAQNQHTSYSAVVEEYVGFALLVKEEKQAAQLLGPQLQMTIKKEVRAMADRMSHFLSRAAFDASNCKQLVFQLVVKEFGEERAFDFRDQAWQASVDDLKKPLEAFESFKTDDDEDAVKTNVPA